MCPVLEGAIETTGENLLGEMVLLLLVLVSPFNREFKKCGFLGVSSVF